MNSYIGVLAGGGGVHSGVWSDQRRNDLWQEAGSSPGD